MVFAVEADPALEEAAGRNRLEAAARLDEVDGLDLDPLVVALDHAHRVAPGQHGLRLAGRVAEDREVDVDGEVLRHGPMLSLGPWHWNRC